MPRAKEFSGRSLSLFAAWILAEYFLLVDIISKGVDINTLVLLIFYLNLPPVLYLIMLGLAMKRRRVEEVTELFDVDAAGGGLAILVGAMATFGLLLFVFGMTSTLHPVPTDLILLQFIIIVPAEEFAFRFFLPRIIPGRLIGIPSWIWAQIAFAAFHFRAFNLDTLDLLIALAFGVGMYLIVYWGKKYRILGMGFAIGVHGVWNLIALSIGGQNVVDPLVALFSWL